MTSCNGCSATATITGSQADLVSDPARSYAGAGYQISSAAFSMSNAKIAALIAEANQQLIEDVGRILLPITQELKQLHAELDQLQSAIAPMATDIERLRAEIRAMQGVGNTPK